MDEYPDAGYESQLVAGGPNDGLWWVKSVAYTMHRGSDIHHELFEDGPRYELTHPSDMEACEDHFGPRESEGGGSFIYVNMYEYNRWCRAADIDGMAAGLWRHEGFGTGSQLNGHEAQAREALKEWNIPRELEGIVQQTEDDHHRMVIDYIVEARGHTHSRGSSELYVSGNWQGKVWEYSHNEDRYLVKDFDF